MAATESPPLAHIVSTGSALPGEPIDNATLGERLGMDRLWEQWVATFVGTLGRHLSFDLDTGKPLGTLADLGEQAGRAALESGGIAPGEIDAVVFGTATPDMLMPATVNIIADRLGIDGVPTYQLQSGCTGAVRLFRSAPSWPPTRAPGGCSCWPATAAPSISTWAWTSARCRRPS